jgi:hypothetical protein
MVDIMLFCPVCRSEISIDGHCRKLRLSNLSFYIRADYEGPIPRLISVRAKAESFVAKQ